MTGIKAGYAQMRSWRVGKRGILLRILAVIVLAVVLWAKFELAKILEYLTWANLRAAIVIQPLIVLGFAIGALRLAMLAGLQGGYWLSFKALVLCYGINTVVPGRISELVKVAYLKHHASISLGAIFAAVFLERVADVLMLGILALGATVGRVPGFESAAGVLAAIAVVILIALPRLAAQAKRLAMRIPSERFRAILDRFFDHAVERLKHRAILGVFALTALMWLVSLAGITVLFSFIGSIPIGLSGALVVFVASTLGGMVPALPGGFGIYEAAVVFVLSRYGYGLDEALALSLTLHGSQIAMSCLLAPLVALSEPTGITSLVKDALAMLGRSPSV